MFETEQRLSLRVNSVTRNTCPPNAQCFVPDSTFVELYYVENGTFV
jgi:hypothetical protein